MMLLPESMANTRNPNEYNTNYVFATQSELSRISLAGALSSWPFRSGGVLYVPGHGSTLVSLSVAAYPPIMCTSFEACPLAILPKQSARMSR